MASPSRDSGAGPQSKIVEDIRECILELKSSSKEGRPVSESDPAIGKFCAALELLLLQGLKVRSGRCFDDYVSFLEECSRTNREVSASFALAAKNGEPEATDSDRGRSFLRHALVNHLLAELIQLCTGNARIVREYYKKSQSVFHNHDLCLELLDQLYDLNDIDFSPDDVDKVRSDAGEDDVDCSDFAKLQAQMMKKYPAFFTDQGAYTIKISCVKSCQSPPEKNDTMEASTKANERNVWVREKLPQPQPELEQQDSGSPSGSFYSCDVSKPDIPGDAPGSDSENPKVRTFDRDDPEEPETVWSEPRDEMTSPLAAKDVAESERLKREREEQVAENKRLKRERDEYSAEVLRLLERTAGLERDKAIREDAYRSLMLELEQKSRLLKAAMVLSERANQSEDDEKGKCLEEEAEVFDAFFEFVQSVCLPDSPRVWPRDPDTGRLDRGAVEKVRTLLEEERAGAREEEGESEAQALRVEVAKLKQALNAVNIEKDLIEERWETIKAASKANSSDLRRRVEQLEGELKTSQETVARLEEELRLAEGEGRGLAKTDGVERHSIIQELRDDMEVLVGSFKRREILAEEMRREFEKATDRLLEEHATESASYREAIGKLEAKVCLELTHEKKDRLEAKIGSLEEKLLSSKEDLLVAQYQFKDKVNFLNDRLESMEEENVSLRNQVSQLSKECKNERATIRYLKDRLEAGKSESEGKVASLKESIVRLLNDKKQLWLKYQEVVEKCSSQEDNNGGDGKNGLLPLPSSNVCLNCNLECSTSHADRTDRLSSSSSCDSNVCNSCADVSLDSKYQTAVENVDDVIGVGKSNDAFYNEPGVDSLLPPEVCVPHQINRSALGVSALARLTGGVKNAAVWATSTAVSSIVKTTGHVSGMFVRSVGPTDVETPFIFDDRFEIITPEEIIESRLILPSDDEAIVLDVIDPTNEDEDTFVLIHEMPAERRLIVPINLKVDPTSNNASSLHWSFHSEPKGVTFGISYHGPLTPTDADPRPRTPPRTADSPEPKTGTSTSTGLLSFGSFVPSLSTSAPSQLFSSFSSLAPTSTSTSTSISASASYPPAAFKFQKSDVLLSLKKVQSHLRSVSGTLIPKAAGVYSFVFDNTRSSLMTKKIHMTIKLVPRSTIPLPTDC